MSARGAVAFVGLYSGDTTNRPTISWDAAGGIGTPAAKNFSFMTLTYKPASGVKRLPDPNGIVMGYHIPPGEDILSVKLTVRAPASGGIALAAVAASQTPPQATKVVIAKLISATDAVINGDWVYEDGAEISYTGDAEAEISFDLHRHLDASGAAVSIASILAVVS